MYAKHQFQVMVGDIRGTCSDRGMVESIDIITQQMTDPWAVKAIFSHALQHTRLKPTEDP